MILRNNYQNLGFYLFLFAVCMVVGRLTLLAFSYTNLSFPLEVMTLYNQGNMLNKFNILLSMGLIPALTISSCLALHDFYRKLKVKNKSAVRFSSNFMFYGLVFVLFIGVGRATIFACSYIPYSLPQNITSLYEQANLFNSLIILFVMSMLPLALISTGICIKEYYDRRKQTKKYLGLQ